MVDGRIALGMVARATSGNRRGGQERQVGIGRRRTCVVRWWWWWWCGGVGSRAGRVAALSRAS
jgi:hypothetical protein